jgi:hypothetical protein
MKPNNQIAASLAFYSFLAAMAFFAVVRFFGLLWFQQEYIPIDISWLAYYVIMGAFLVAEGFIITRCLTASKWLVCLLCAAGYLGFLYICVYPFAMWTLFWCDLGYIFLVPLCLNWNKGRLESFIASLIFAGGISLYQGIMMFGRGYPAISKYDAAWQILATIDYKFFLVILLLKKELVSNAGKRLLSLVRACRIFPKNRPRDL